MEYRLACDLSDKIAAFGSVNGNFMLDTDLNDCLDQEREIPIIHFHGTADGGVNYYPPSFDNALTVGESAEFWQDYNSLDNLLSANKPPIFWKEKPLVKKQLSIWQIDELKKANKEISYIEMLCKKNPKFAKIIFFKFISSICKKANNFS